MSARPDGIIREHTHESPEAVDACPECSPPSHDPMCPAVPCDCEPDAYGHMPECRMHCLCRFIANVRADERTRHQI